MSEEFSIGAVVECVFDFEAQEGDELDLAVGDRVVITNVVDDEWLEVCCALHTPWCRKALSGLPFLKWIVAL
jgi:hypothetical protein